MSSQVSDHPATILRSNLRNIPGLDPDWLESEIKAWISKDRFPAPDPVVRDAHRRAIEPVINDLSVRCRGPILLEGISPPWILESILSAPKPTGSPYFAQRVVVLQASWHEFFDGLSQASLGDAIADPRVVWFVGDDASTRLLEWFDERIDDAPPSFVVQNPSLKIKSSPDAPGLFREIENRWTHNEAGLIERLKSRTPRDLGWWVKRYNGELPEHGPLRVLLPVSRYTTYLQHIASDVREAVRSLGMECEIIIERDQSTVMSQCSIMRSIATFDPDLIISINYPRKSLGRHVPGDIPHLCWIQDAMDHLFQPDAGKAIGARDFVVGMVNTKFNDIYKYPLERTRWMPMVASRTKFRPGQIAPAFDAEIAWATHQSEHPDIMRDRLLREIGAHALHLVDPLRSLLQEAEQCTTTITHENLFHELQRLVEQHFFPGGVQDAARPFWSNLTFSMVIPYAERVMRHHTAAWAADMCERRGWRLKLYGEGWEQHPTLSKHAAGTLEHSSALRDAYQRSVVQLHASINQTTHQRVSECILSGGLPLCRTMRHSFELARMLIASESRLLPETRPDDAPDANPRHWYTTLAENPAAADYVHAISRLGLCHEKQFADGRMRWNQAQLERANDRMQDRVSRDNAKMFNSLTDLYFANPSGLESLVERAIEDPKWRERRIEQAIDTVPSALTTDGFLTEVFEMIASYQRDELTSGS